MLRDGSHVRAHRHIMSKRSRPHLFDVGEVRGVATLMHQRGQRRVAAAHLAGRSMIISTGPRSERDSPSRVNAQRVIESKHSTEIGAQLTLSVNASSGVRRRTRRCSVGQVLALNTSPASSGVVREVKLAWLACQVPSCPV